MRFPAVSLCVGEKKKLRLESRGYMRELEFSLMVDRVFVLCAMILDT